MDTRKRSLNDLSPLKRMKLGDVSRNFQLASPPVTPEKNRVVHLDHFKGKKLVFSPSDREIVIRDEDAHAGTAGPTHTARSASVYGHAKSLFQKTSSTHSDTPNLVGREDEAATILDFVSHNIRHGTSSSIYISGPPGTGKTAQVAKVLRHLLRKSSNDSANFVHHRSRVRTVHINCMTLIARPENVFHEVYCGLNQLLSTTHAKRKTADDLQRLLQSSTAVDSLVVVLDELDCLLTKDQLVIFTLFRLANHETCPTYSTKLVLMAISNALDLTDKFLPRLKANGLLPATLQFLPYTALHIQRIVELKLRSLVDEDKENVLMQHNEICKPVAPLPIIHPTAIILCSKKAAAITGDLRKAFDIFYQSIELAEEEQRKKLTEDQFDGLTLHTAPRVMINHIAKVCSRSFGDNSLAKLQSLNLHQKTVLCCLFNHQSQTGTESTINTFYDFYVRRCGDHADRLLGKLRKGEFLDIISALESLSVVSVVSSRGALRAVHQDFANKTIKPNVTYEDCEKCTENVGVLRRILKA